METAKTTVRPLAGLRVLELGQLIAGPFAGKAQLTIAGDRVFESRALDIAQDGTVVEIETAAQWGTGAYAIVSLYRPLLGGRPHDPERPPPGHRTRQSEQESNRSRVCAQSGTA